MISIGLTVLSAAVWTGSAQVEVMIWEPGGEHPYTTVFQLTYREADRVPILGPNGVLLGHSIRLIPERIAIDVRHEVRHTDGGRICEGGGHELVPEGPEGRIVLPTPGASPLEFNVPATGAYQLVLPRAVGAFACGTKRNARDRRVVVGSGLFHPSGEIETADPDVRGLDPGGLPMHGIYQSSDASRGGPVRHDYTVRWDLRRRVQE